MKIVFLSLIIASNCFVLNAFAIENGKPSLEVGIKMQNLFDVSNDIKKFESINTENDKAKSIDLSIQVKNVLETPHDQQEFERTKSGATDAIKMGITPQWAEVNSSVDRERMGYGSISFEKKYNKKMDADLEEFAKRISKG